MRTAFLVACAAFCVTPALSQATVASATQPSAAAFTASGYSTSLDRAVLDPAVLDPDAPDAPSAAVGGGQYQSGYRPQQKPRTWTDHVTFEAGAGFTTPLNSDSAALNTAWNIRLGAGWNFIPSLGILAEYEFDRFGATDNVINEAQADDGNTHLWSFVLEPVYRYKITKHFGGYIEGGGGFYRALTSYTDEAEGIECDPFYGCYPVGENYVASHFSSNQGGWNAGGGFTFKTDPDSRFAYFTDVRFESLSTPGHTSELIPVNFGVRW